MKILKNDMLVDEKNVLWEVIDITNSQLVIENKITAKRRIISKGLLNGGETGYKKVEVTKDCTITRRPYIARMERLMDEVNPKSVSEAQFLYELVSEIFRSGFNEEFMNDETV
nr:MAG TPA: hypothetical protein [Caudoviricetes sp.]